MRELTVMQIDEATDTSVHGPQKLRASRKLGTSVAIPSNSSLPASSA